MSVIMMASICSDAAPVKASDGEDTTSQQTVEQTMSPDASPTADDSLPEETKLPEVTQGIETLPPEAEVSEVPEETKEPQVTEDTLEKDGEYYLLQNADDFDFVRQHPDEKYKLKSDIDFKEAALEPIGTIDVPFSGELNGNGCTVKNLTIQTEQDYAGLFGVIENAYVHDMTFETVSVTGNDYVGSLAGYAVGADKKIENCTISGGSVNGHDFTGGLLGATDEKSTVSSTVIKNVNSDADVTADGNKTGGIVGYIKGSIYGSSSTGDVSGYDCIGGIAGQSSGGTIEVSYTKGKLTGNMYTGGLIGIMNGGTIEQCYSLKELKGNVYAGGLLGESSGGTVENSFVIGTVNGSSYVGGLIGQCTTITYLTNCYVSAVTLSNDSMVGGICSKEDNLKIQNSYFDTTVSELDVQATSDAGKTTAQMRKQESFESWNFNSVWSIEEGQSYPYLTNLPKPEEIAGPPVEEDMQGDGTKDSPYIVKTKKQLFMIQNNLSAYFKLGADINLGGIEWTPVGSTSMPFTGGLDGNGFSISNFQITKSTVNYVGFFTAVFNAEIKNITFDHGVIAAKSYAGTVAGQVLGTDTILEQISVTNASVSGTSYLGGLFGIVSAAATAPISFCYADATVTAAGERAGAIVGNLTGSLTNSYAAGIVKGTNHIGGLVGLQAGTADLTQCYSKVLVAATGKNIGGLVGCKVKGTISNSFALGEVSGTSVVGGILGAATSAVTISNCYGAEKLSGAAASLGGIAGSISYLTIKNTCYDGTVSGVVPRDLVQVSKTTKAMTKKSSYTEWDFETVWDMEDGKTYPYLKTLPKPDGIASEVPEEQTGSGTLEDPYVIRTVKDLDNIRYEMNAHYVLGNDIDLNGMEWIPIGTSAAPFTGTLDGAGYQIFNFTITLSTMEYVGLFGVVKNAEIKNITVKDYLVTGKNYVGSLAGSIQGTGWNIIDCHVSGGKVTGVTSVGGLFGNTTAASINDMSGCSSSAEVTAAGSHAGGIVGSLSGKLTGSYAVGKVTGASNVGGLVGYQVSASSIAGCYSTAEVKATTARAGGIIGYKAAKGSISNCYVLGIVSGTAGVGGIIGAANAAVMIENSYVAASIHAVNKTIGGIAGVATNITVTNSFYDGLLCGLASSGEAQTSKLTESLMRKATFTGWDFENTWDIEEGKTYPFLRNLPKPAGVTTDVEALITEGAGTKEDPYIIRTAEQLQAVKYEVTAYYKLAEDIDLEGVEWTPIGTASKPFSGGFDGNNHTVSNFIISKGTVDNIGFFGVIGSSEIKDFTVRDFTVNGKNDVGGLIGKVSTADRILTNCHVENGKVCGTSYVGGLIGFVAKVGTSDIEGCSSNADVIGTASYTGNLIGYLYGNLTNSYAKGTTQGETYVGGLAGYSNAGVIDRCYAVVKATNGTYVGGIAGYKYSGTIKNSYAVGSITGTNYIGGVVGTVYTTMYLTNCYSSVSIKAAGANVGGLCCANTNIKMAECYYDGMVSNLNPLTKYDCSYLTPTLMRQASFAGWDFETVWNIEENSSYPYLKESGKPEEVTVEKKDSFPEGKGTAEEPYEITTAKQLNFVKEEPTASYVLVNDIDLEDSEWEPIGINTNAPFTGTFDGNGHVISNFTVSQSTASSIGFFGVINNGTVKGLNLDNARVTGKNYVGALVGYVMGTTWVIDDCHITNTRTAGVGCIGGLVGNVAGAGRDGITNSSAKVEVVATGDRVGGLVGNLVGNVTKCYVTGNIQGANMVGGIAGCSGSGVIEQCYATGDITGATKTAGLVGYKTAGKIENCYNLGTVTGTNYVSGILGAAASTKVSITNCYTAAVITGTGTYVGGIYGTKGAVAAVNSYYNRTVNPSLTVVDAHARYTSGLKRRANFTDWDFDTIWSIHEYKTYPSLQGMDEPEGIEGPVATDLPEGSGTKEDPYMIKTKQQLISVKYDLTAYYEIANDIDLGGMEWEPIGNFETPFTGHLNGNGFTVSNFTINTETIDYTGLFGVVSGAVISNLTISGVKISGAQYAGGVAGLAVGETTSFTQCHVIDGFVKGSSYIGGIVGKFEGGSADGLINCYASVEVTAAAEYAGGIAGWVMAGISGCYSEGTVTGVTYVGGIVGYVMTVTIQNSFVLGSVTGENYVGGIVGACGETAQVINCYFAAKITASEEYAGGIYGCVTGITITHCYYDGIVSGLVPKTENDPSRLTNGMKSAVNFAEWDFTAVWTIDEGMSYPYLKALNKPEHILGITVKDAPKGAGTKENPYIIMTAAQLVNIRFELGAYYKLGADIDLKDIDWNPLGTKELPFTGHFDGNGFVIKNLTITHSEMDYLGLFGVVRNAVILNVKMEGVSITGAGYIGALIGYAVGEDTYICNCNVADATISGGTYVGGIVGYAAGTIVKCYVYGKVTGSTYVGGIVGYAIHVVIEKSYSTATVFAVTYVGGIVGYSWDVTVHYCFVYGAVSGTDYVAGIIGVSGFDSSIVECYVAGRIVVTGTIVGGLCSSVTFITVTKSWYDGIATGIIPRLSIDYCRLGGMIYKASYSEWDFTAVWDLEEGKSYPFLRELPKPEFVYQIDMTGRPGGRGVEDDPYQITTLEQLKNVDLEPNSWFVLGNDIDLEGKGLIPIGDSIKPFSGVFLGNGHTISNFVLDAALKDCVGFFGETKGAVIKDLTLSDAKVTGKNKVGALIGYADGNTKIEGCTTDVCVTGKNYVGGIVGYAAESLVNTSSGLGDVNGVNYVGGITGYSFYSTLLSCESISTITGSNYIGGIAGYSNIGIVKECQSFTSVFGKRYVGGIIGYNNGATIDTCQNLKDTNGDVLPLLKASNETAVAELSDSYASVTGTTYVGGLIGYAYGGTEKACNSEASVTGTIYVGGLIGFNVGSMNQDCTSNAAVEGTKYTNDLIGYTKGE